MSIEKFHEVMPRAVFCALGNWTPEQFGVLKEVINKAGFEFDDEYSQLEPDDRMVASFAVSKDTVNPSFTKEDDKAVESHKGVAYFLAPMADDREDLQNILGKALILVKHLFTKLGVTAFKSESSGNAHGKDRWIELSESYTNDEEMMTLYHAFVKKPLESDYSFYTCGMHLLGLQDVFYYYDNDVETEMEAALNMAKIAEIIQDEDGDYEEIEEEIEDSDLNNNNPKLLECKFYNPDEFFYNPYGYVYVNDGD